MQRLFEILRDSRLMYGSAERYLRAVYKVLLVQLRWEPQPGVQQVALKSRSTGKPATMTVFEGEEEAYLSKTAAEMNDGEDSDMGYLGFRLGLDYSPSDLEGDHADYEEDDDNVTIGPRRPSANGGGGRRHGHGGEADEQRHGGAAGQGGARDETHMASDLGDVSHTGVALSMGVATARPPPGQVEASRAAANSASLASDVEALQSGSGHGHGYEYGAEPDLPPGDTVGDVSGGAFGDQLELEQRQALVNNGDLSVKHADETARPNHVSSTQLFSHTRQIRLGRVTQAQDEERERTMAANLTGLGDDAGLGPEAPLSSPRRGSNPYVGAGAGPHQPAPESGGDEVEGEEPPPKSPRMMPAPEDES